MSARIIGAALAFTTQVFVARWFGAESLGLLALAFALANVLACLAPLGFHSVAIFFIAEYNARKRPDLAHGFMRTSQLQTTVVATVISVIFLVSLWLFGAQLVAPEKRIPLACGVVIAPTLAAIYLNSGIAFGYQRYGLGSLIDSLLRPGLLLVGFGLLIIFLPNASIIHLLIFSCALLWCLAITQSLLIKRARLIPENVKPTYETSRWRKATLPWLVIALLSEFFNDIDLLLVSSLSSTADIAILNACFRLRVLFGFGLRTVYNLILPDVYESHTMDDFQSVQKKFRRANIIALSFVLIALVGVVVFGELFLGLFGEVFKNGHFALIILVASLSVRAAFGPTTIALTMRGIQFHAVWVLFIGLTLLVALNVFLVPKFGVDGAAIAAAAYHVFVSIGLWLIVWVKTGNNVSIFSFLTFKR